MRMRSNIRDSFLTSGHWSTLDSQRRCWRATSQTDDIWSFPAPHYQAIQYWPKGRSQRTQLPPVVHVLCRPRWPLPTTGISIQSHYWQCIIGNKICCCLQGEWVCTRQSEWKRMYTIERPPKESMDHRILIVSGKHHGYMHLLILYLSSAYPAYAHIYSWTDEADILMCYRKNYIYLFLWAVLQISKHWWIGLAVI